MLSQCWKDTHNDLGDARVKFSNFLFPESRDPAHDGRVIDETLREARLTDELGFEVIWLAEHHFDGICAYVDPVSFAAALAVATQRAKIGFAVAQMSLHHPIRMAEQLALIDNISKGRLIVGLGRGTAYNIYDYQGYGLDHTEAQARFEEAEAIMFQAWRGEKFEHRGRFWDIKLPMLRPLPFTQPHPFCDPLGLERGGDAAHRAAGPPVHDERAVERGDAAPHGPVPPHAARTGHGRRSCRAQRRAMLGVAQCLRRRDRCGSRAHRDPGIRGDARAPHGDAPAGL